MSRRTATAPDSTAAALGRQPLTSAEVDEVIEVALMSPMDGYPGNDNCKWGMPLLIEGPPGASKTARIKQIAEDMRAELYSIYAATHPPEDFSGALIPDGSGGARQIVPLQQVRKLIEEGRGILFLDEINGAPPATQGALMSLIHERHTGDSNIPGHVRVIAAQNPEAMAAAGYRMSPPLANRFMHISYQGPTAREWGAWLMGTKTKRMGTTMENMENVIIDDWPDKYPTAIALFTGFMESRPSSLHKMPQLSDEQSGKAWPSPRTWDFATRVWTTAKIMEKSDAIVEALIAACVGDGATTELLEYARSANIPKPLDVINGKWKIDRNRLDVVLAAYTGMVAYIRQRPERKEKEKLAIGAWAALAKLLDANLSDIVIPASEGMIQERLGHGSGSQEIKDAANLVLAPLAQSGLKDYMEQRV